MSDESQDSTEQTPETDAPAGPVDIVAKAGFPYLWRRWLMTFILLGVGLWCLYDGFVKMPRDNENARETARAEGRAIDEKHLPHPGWDIPFNKGLGCFAPPLALIFFGWSMYNCRGKISLQGRTLSVPGHPPFTADFIRSIDKSRWDKKGIAKVTYQTPEMSQSRQLTLDDFLYDQGPIDEIVKQLEEMLKTPAPARTAPAAPKVSAPTPAAPRTAAPSKPAVAAPAPTKAPPAVKPPPVPGRPSGTPPQRIPPRPPGGTPGRPPKI